MHFHFMLYWKGSAKILVRNNSIDLKCFLSIDTYRYQKHYYGKHDYILKNHEAIK